MYACARVSIMHPFLQLCDYNNPNAKKTNGNLGTLQIQNLNYWNNTRDNPGIHNVSANYILDSTNLSISLFLGINNNENSFAVIVLFVRNLCFVVVLLVHSTCCDCFICTKSVLCCRFVSALDLLWLFYLYEICALLSFCWCTRLVVIVLFVWNLCFVVVLLVHSTCCDCFICTKSVLCCRFVGALDLLWLFYLCEICALLSFC